MKPLNIISLIGSNRIIVEPELRRNGFTLDDYGDYGEHTYGVYSGALGIRKINIKFKKNENGEFVETVIVY